MLVPYDPKVFTWEGDNKYMPAIEILKQRAKKTDFKQMPGIPFGWNYPFNRALQAITGQKNYYRWGMGASGSPKSPLMKVQEKPFVPRQATPVFD